MVNISRFNNRQLDGQFLNKRSVELYCIVPTISRRLTNAGYDVKAALLVPLIRLIRIHALYMRISDKRT